jgi:hypothetical protein
VRVVAPWWSDAGTVWRRERLCRSTMCNRTEEHAVFFAFLRETTRVSQRRRRLRRFHTPEDCQHHRHLQRRRRIWDAQKWPRASVCVAPRTYFVRASVCV